MSKNIILIIGVAIGLLLPYAVDFALFNDATPVNITTNYEDGSFKGCMAGGICNE